MFLSRRKAKTPAPERYEQRREYRLDLPGDHTVRMILLRHDGSQIGTTLIDLTVRGARFRLRNEGVQFEPDEVFEAIIATDGSWVVRTPAMIRRQSVTPDGIDWGMEFINPGNLYGQWENVLGQFFNRRFLQRTGSDLDRPLAANLASKGFKMNAVVYDLTVRGVGLLVSHIESASLKLNDPARVTLHLPGMKKALVGPAIIRHRRRFENRDIVGLEFDVTVPEGFLAHEDEIAEFCAQRERELALWEESWSVEEPEDGAASGDS